MSELRWTLPLEMQLGTSVDDFQASDGWYENESLEMVTAWKPEGGEGMEVPVERADVEVEEPERVDDETEELEGSSSVVTLSIQGSGHRKTVPRKR